MRIRIALWGSGEIAKKFARAVQVNSNFELVGVASRTFEHAQLMAREYGIKAYDSYDELLKKDNIDFIYVSTPTRHHYSDMQRIIKTGKNIICEKPFTESAEEAREVFRCAEDKGVIIVDGLWSMYMPLFEYILHKSQDMGRLFFASASLGWPSLTKHDHEVTSKYELWDYEIYPVSIMTRLFGFPNKVRSKTKYTGNLASENSSLLSFHNGGLGRVHASLKHRSSYIFIGIYRKGIIISRKWWLGNQRVYVFKFLRFPIFRKFAHVVNGYEYEVSEIQNRVGDGSEARMSRSDTISILSVLDRVKQTLDDR